MSIAIGLALFQAAVLAACGSVATLSCDRQRDSCVLESGTLLSPSTQRFPLSSVVRARVDESSSRDADGEQIRSTQLVLSLRAGAYEFNVPDSLAWESAQVSADRINAFLADPRQATLVARQDSRLKWFLMTSVFIWGMPLTIAFFALLKWLRS